MIGMMEHAQFAHLFNGDDAFRRRALHKQRLEHGGFAGSCCIEHKLHKVDSFTTEYIALD